MSSPVTLMIRGHELVDFKQATVSYSLESFARSFHIDLSDKWQQRGRRALPFAEGDPCEIYVHGELVIDGYIDDVPISYTEKSRSITVSGRSWTGHLVDCSAVYRGGSWSNASLERVARDLAEPFGVEVYVDPWAREEAAKPFSRWAIEDEETAFGCMQRAAELRGLFLTSDATRTVVITKAAPTMHPGALVWGQNIKRGRRIGRFAERFSHYIVKSQHAGSDTYYAEKTTGPFARAEDPQVLSYRPLIIVSSGSGTKTELTRRAAWERNMRAGRSRRVTYDVHGHLSPAGRVWPINEQIAVDDEVIGVFEPLLLASVNLTYGAKGELASLELCRPEAFDVLISPPKPRRRVDDDGGIEDMMEG